MKHILFLFLSLTLLLSCSKESTQLIPTMSNTYINGLSPTSISIVSDITSDGGAQLIARGVCWSTSQNPTISDNKTIDGTSIGTFTSKINDLTPGTTYYVRSYAINSVGTIYSDQLTIKTNSIIATVLTVVISNITSTTASSGGNVTSDGGSHVTSKGVCWSTSQNPTISDNKTIDTDDIGYYQSSITGLTPGTTYYVRSYAINSVGVAYGDQLTMKTTINFIIPNGLIGYYPFNENANDLSKNANNGIIYGATLTSDRFGNNNRAYSFNGINNFISVNHNDLLNSFPITINVWCKNFSQSATVITKYIGCSNDGWEINISNFGSNCKVSSYYYNNYSSIGYINFDTNNVTFAYDNNWHMITAIYDNDGGKIFLDNNLILTKPFTEAPKKCINTESMVIGKNIQGKCGNTGYYKGLIDDIRIYNRSLNLDEFTLLYNEK